MGNTDKFDMIANSYDTSERVQAEYYFFKDGELSHEDKQRILRSIVREIQISLIKSRCSAFKFPEK